MEKVSVPSFKVLYGGKDITADITPYMISLEYTDKVEGESDEVQLQVEDVAGIWRTSWYPEKGATLEVHIGMDGVMVPCGTFEIDEVEFTGAPDVVNIRGLAVPISGTLRTKRSYAHEKKTLRQIATAVAQRNGLELVGQVSNVTIDRVTQNRETDLSFLKRVASEYGYVFSVRGQQLVFTTIYELEAAPPSTAVDRIDLISYSIRDKTAETYTQAEVQYHDPKKNNVVTATNSDAVPADTGATKGDTLALRGSKVENRQQAELKAKAALYRANSEKQIGTITVPGNTLLVAGNNFELTGMGVVSGVYHIISSRHRIDRSGGYTTSVEMKRVATVGPEKQVSTKRPEAELQRMRTPQNVRVTTAADLIDTNTIRLSPIVPA